MIRWRYRLALHCDKKKSFGKGCHCSKDAPQYVTIFCQRVSRLQHLVYFFSQISDLIVLPEFIEVEERKGLMACGTSEAFFPAGPPPLYIAFGYVRRLPKPLSAREWAHHRWKQSSDVWNRPMCRTLHCHGLLPLSQQDQWKLWIELMTYRALEGLLCLLSPSCQWLEGLTRSSS